MSNLPLARRLSAASRRAPRLRFWLPPLLLGGPLLLLLIGTRFDGLYGQDAYAYYRYATGPLRENLLALQPPPPFFWPPGYPLLVALVSLVLGPVPAAGQAVSLVAGALTPLFTALLARELWPGKQGLRVALLAALLVALTPQLWQSSAVIMSDTAGLAAATLGAWAVARYGGGAGGRWLLLAATALAFAVLTRWAYALVAIPTTVYAFYALAQRARPVAARQAFGAALIVLVVLSPPLFSALAAEPLPGSERTPFIGDLEVVPWHPKHLLQRTFTNSDGVLRYRLPNGLYYALAPAHRFFFTPLLAPLLLPGLWLLWRRRTTAHLSLLLAWAAIVYLFLAGAPWQNFRFTLSYLPPVAVIAAAGADTVARRLPQRWRPFFGGAVVAGFLWMAWGGWSLSRSFIERKDANLATMEWVEMQVDPEARLFTFGITLTFEQYSDLEVYDLFLLSPEEMNELLSNGRPIYLLLDEDNIQRQWADRSPGVNYRWLQRQTELVPRGQHRHFVLFRVIR